MNGVSETRDKERIPVTVIDGDGIGPEVVGAARRMLDAVGAPIDWQPAEAGAAVFKRGVPSGVPRDTLDAIERTRLVLKGPLETPIGHGEKSANVTLRKVFETFGNVRPVREFAGVPTPYAGRGVDLTIVRENVEDLYAGIEHQQTPDVAQCLKLISRSGCERIVRLAFESTLAEGRTSLVCATKANIMKLTEGLMKRVFEEIADEYPGIEARHLIVDNCAHQLVRRPEQFDVIVTTNMNGDILSDLSSALVGGLGFAPSANLGADVAMFEAVHGSAPKYAGQDVANPTALILSGAMLLRHVGLVDLADRVEEALSATLAKGIHTRDVTGGEPVGTAAFTDSVIEHLDLVAVDGVAPLRSRRGVRPAPITSEPSQPRERTTVGVDIFVEWSGTPSALAGTLVALADASPFQLSMISNRGTMVYPGTARPALVDHFRCRFLIIEPVGVTDAQLLDLLERISARHRWMHVERLQSFDGIAGFTRAQGEDAA